MIFDSTIDPKVVAAIVTSICSIIIATYTNYRQRKSDKHFIKKSLENSRTLEYLKAELSRKNEFQTTELKNKADALHKSSNAIQLLKDDLRKIKMSVEDSVDLEPILDEVKKSTENLTRIYAESHLYLNQIDSDLMYQIHRAKNIAISIQSEFQKEISLKDKNHKISPSFIKHIIDRKNELNEIDIRLIDKKVELSFSNSYLK